MSSKYRPTTQDDPLTKLGYVVEECGELQKAIGKTIRWGFDSFNPELPPEERVTNEDQILLEMDDVEYGISLLRTLIQDRKKALVCSICGERYTVLNTACGCGN